jgi:hypothetical protein
MKNGTLPQPPEPEPQAINPVQQQTEQNIRMMIGDLQINLIAANVRIQALQAELEALREAMPSKTEQPAFEKRQ